MNEPYGVPILSQKCYYVVCSLSRKTLYSNKVESTTAKFYAKNLGSRGDRERALILSLSFKEAQQSCVSWLTDRLMTSAYSARHHVALSLNSSWLSQSWILIHEIKVQSYGRGAWLLAAWISLKHLLCIQTRPRRTGNQTLTYGHLVQWPELSFLRRLMKHKDANLFLSTHHNNRLSAACQFNIASLQCSGKVPTGKGQKNLVQEFLWRAA